MFTVGQLWAVSAVLLARRGGKAMGEGGLFPTPCGPCAKPLGSLKLMHCPLFCLAAVQEMKQKRVKGKKVTQTYGLAPPLWAVEPALPRAEPGW